MKLKAIVLIVAIVIGGCSYARIKNTVGGPNGLTYSKKEKTAPIANKQITLKKVDGKIIILNKAVEDKNQVQPRK